MWRVKFVRNPLLLALFVLPQLLVAEEADPCHGAAAGSASVECIQSLQHQISELKSLM